MILKVLAVVFIIFFLILIHEFGHYIVAKRNGVKVHEFAIGFAPFVFTFKKFDTLFRLGILPLGGYVKLHGEDSSDSKIRKDKSSFASKTPWQKTKIICAGVFMNFLVFWVLFSINLMVGSDPLVLNQADFQKHINSPATTLYHGSYVKDAQDVNLIDTKIVESESISTFHDSMGPVHQTDKIDTLNLDFYPTVSLPVLEVVELQTQSPFLSDLVVGDRILKINNKIVFSDSHLNEMLNAEAYELKVLRGDEIFNISYSQNKLPKVVSQVLEGSVAEIAGVSSGFKLLSIEGIDDISQSNLPELVLNYIDESKQAALKYVFLNNTGQIEEISLTPSDAGAIGVYLTDSHVSSGLGLSYFFTSEDFSVLKKPVEQYPVHIAPFVALQKGFELSKLTAVSISKTFFKIFTRLEVSEEVGGPIQVFKTGYNFVSIGGTALLSFIAMISLTLAVVNILPIPALDGGRLLFVIIEAFRGKPLNPKYESVIHALGFILLLFLIVTISIFDIIRL